MALPSMTMAEWGDMDAIRALDVMQSEDGP
jgi:hypothetical protein